MPVSFLDEYSTYLLDVLVIKRDAFDGVIMCLPQDVGIFQPENYVFGT